MKGIFADMSEIKCPSPAITMLNALVMLSMLSSLPFTTSASLLQARQTSISTAPTVSFVTSEPHTPFSGTPSTTGALTATSIGTGISAAASVAPAQTTYPSDGRLHQAQPAPYFPGGGVGLSGNGSIPVYNAESDFDYESLALALYQGWLELDLFQDGLRRFTANDFKAAGLSDADRGLIQSMADQKIGQITLISNILGASAPKQCQYNYPYTTVLEFLDFCQKLSGVAESNALGFLAHLSSSSAAALMAQSITTESRQQMIFRQFSGLFPMPVWFEVGVPQSWAWSLLAPYIASCPSNQTRLVWENFPPLRILNQPSLYGGGGGSNASNNTISPGTNVVKSLRNATANSTSNCGVGVTPNKYTRLSFPGRQVSLQWDLPGKPVGPNNSYITSTQAGNAKYVAWVSQLNVTYTPLRVAGNRGYTVQPDLQVYEGDPLVNGTVFIAVTDSELFVTPYNLSMINPHVVAGPALYQAG